MGIYQSFHNPEFTYLTVGNICVPPSLVQLCINLINLNLICLCSLQWGFQRMLVIPDCLQNLR